MLYIVPTPIGNLADITLRALETLKKVAVILAEDTRKTKILLNHYNIKQALQSFHIHNEHNTLAKVLEQLKSGQTMALVSDAGTPAISDPGFLLVRACIAAGIKVECLPGATALIPALVNSGLPCDRFTFEGFLPQKKGRKTKLIALEQETRTMVFYESPFRLVKTLKQFQEHFGANRPVSVARELSKIYEENVRGTIPEVLAYFENKKVKGEIVIVVGGYKEERRKGGKMEEL